MIFEVNKNHEVEGMLYKNLNNLIAVLIIIICISVNSAHALDAATDLVSHTSTMAPTTIGNTTTIPVEHSVDLYHWSQFNLGAGETANFVFSANGQTAVNYLNPGANPSTILGNITGSGASGNVMLFNPNGIIISGNGTVSNLNTFFASTHQFNGVSGNQVLFSEPAIANALNVNNINLTNVNNAHFVAPGVIFNAGQNIAAKDSFGIRGIGGGQYDVSNNTFSNEVGVKTPISALGDNLVKIDTGINKITSKDITIETKGNYAANADIHFNGTLEAKTAVVGQNGSIYLLAENSNTSENSGAQIILDGLIGGERAKVEMKAQKLIQKGTIDVSGIAAGGEINLIATDMIKQEGTLKANCTGENGNGGNINIISKGTADVSGTIEAKKGSTTGAGGNVEISALEKLILSANVDTTGGFLTIDPININISILDPTYTPAYVQGLLAGSNTILYADNDITVNSPLSWTSGNSLTLDTGRSITINSNITTNGGLLSLIANDVNNPTHINVANRSSGLGGITTAGGVTINAGIGNISFLTQETGATYLAADTVIGSNINANNLTVANKKNITQLAGSTITVGNDTNLYTPANVTLNQSSNNFNATSSTGQMYIRGLTENATATNATIRDTNDLRMGEVGISNDLTLTAGRDITQCASTAIKVGNNTRLNAPRNIILDRIWNDFNNNTSLTGQLYINDGIAAAINATIVDSKDLRMGNVNVSNDLILTARLGDITQYTNTAIKVGNNTDLNARQKGTITLANANNNFGQNGTGQVKISSLDNPAAKATITDIDALRMGNVNISNSMTLTAGGDITQVGGTTISVGGASSLTAGTSNITLNSSTNDFVGAVSIVSSNNASITDANALQMGASTVGGALTLIANGTITQSGALAVTGTTNLTAGTNNISLTNQYNDFKGALSVVSANDAEIRDANALLMNNSNITNNLTLTAGGNITQGTGSKIEVGFNTYLNTTGEITLDQINNDFSKDTGRNGQVYIASASNKATSATITDANLIKLGDIYTSGALTVKALSGSISEGAQRDINVGTNMTLNATNGGISQEAGIAGDNTTITVGGSLIMTTTGTNPITQGTNATIAVKDGTNINITGSGTGAVTLNNGGNDFCQNGTGYVFVGTASNRAASVALTDANSIRLGDIYASGNLVVNTLGGGITEGPQDDINVGGNVTLNAINGSIFQSAGIPADKTTLVAGGNLIMTTTGTNTISQAANNAYITVNNDTKINTTGSGTGAITLNSNDNNFCQNGTGQVYIGISSNKAASANIVDSNFMKLGDIYTNGQLVLRALSGNIIEGAQKDVITDGNMILHTPSGGFSQEAGIAGDNTTITVGGDLTITTDGVSAVSQGINATFAVNNNLNINTVATGGTGSVTLNNSGNDFCQNGTGKVSIGAALHKATSVTLNDVNSINFGTSYVAGTLSTTAGLDINVEGALNADGGINFSAGRGIGINANVTTSGGNATLIANNGSHAGTPANITMASGTTIGAPNGNVDIQLLNNPDAGKITLGNITASTISALNKSLAASTDVIINPLSTLNATSTTAANPLIVSSDGGNFTNNSGATALTTAIGHRWLVYTGSPAGTFLNGLVPVGVIYNATYVTVPPTSVPPGNYVLYRVGPPYTPGPSNGAAAAASAAALVPVALASSSYGGLTPLILYPLAYRYPDGITGAAVPVIDTSRPMYRVYVDKKGRIKKIEVLPNG